MRREQIEAMIFEILDRCVLRSSIERTECDANTRQQWLTTHRFWFDVEMQDAEARTCIEKAFAIELPHPYDLYEKSDQEIIQMVVERLERPKPGSRRAD